MRDKNLKAIPLLGQILTGGKTDRAILRRLRLLEDDKLAFLVILSVSEESRGSLPPAARRLDRFDGQFGV